MESRFQVVGTVDDEACEAERFLTEGEEAEKSYRDGVRMKLMYLVKYGFQNVPDTWSRVVDRQEGVWELRHGPLRLFYFKGSGQQIAVCVCGRRKKGRKVDPQAVGQACRARRMYGEAVKYGTLIEESRDETK
jgi:putative component of toxin-antitoxin plasmid stabilization module